MENLKICYIGGGSKMWARIFMNDLALNNYIEGEVALYDIDIKSAQINKMIGERINQLESRKAIWNYQVYESLPKALMNAKIVVISILPGTFDEMRSDVHSPEKYGIYQSVGDTVGPGGVLRAMRTVPIYEEFAKSIKEYCPNAWVINLTNPMSICIKTLYDVYPNIKAFGCCHEVFHAQKFLCKVIEEELGIKGLTRKDIYTDISGINHFTWITEAKYKDIDIFSFLPSFIDKHFSNGFYEEGNDQYAFKSNPFAYGNNVKMTLFKQYGILAAAGDRHLVEFMNNKWFIENEKMVKEYKYNLTTVDYRIKQYDTRKKDSFDIATGIKEVSLSKSNEELLDIILAILGYKTIITNVNMPNKGQITDLPLNSIVESNCIFSNNMIKPVHSNSLPRDVLNLVYRNCINIDCCYEGIKQRNMNMIFNSFINQPLCSNLNYRDAKELFMEMVNNTKNYLYKYYELDKEF